MLHYLHVTWFTNSENKTKFERERESTDKVKYVAILEFRVNSSRDFN